MLMPRVTIRSVDLPAEGGRFLDASPECPDEASSAPNIAAQRGAPFGAAVSDGDGISRAKT